MIKIYEQIKELSRLYFLSQEGLSDILEKMEKLIESHLVHSPDDIDMLIRLALVVWQPPLADDLKAIACLDKVIALDPMNVKALLMLAYIKDIGIKIDQSLLDKLKKATYFPLDDESLGMLYLAMSWAYFSPDRHLRMQMLHESIKYAPKLVKNYLQLGRAYMFEGKKDLGRSYICHGLKNVISIDNEYPDHDITDIDQEIDIFIRGTYMTHINFEMAIDELDPLYVDPLAHFYT